MDTATLEPDIAPKKRHNSNIVCWILVAIFALIAIMRVFGLERGWYLTTMLAFTPYLAMVSIVPLILALVLKRWPPAIVAGVTVVALACVFLPRFVGHPDPGHGPTLRVMSQNMKVGAADPATIVRLVREHRIDLLALEEFTPSAQAALEAAGLGTLLPFSQINPIEGAFGSGIYSRYPLTNGGYQPLAILYGQEYATVTVPGAAPLEFYAVHTAAPVYPHFQGDWTKALAEEPAATPKGTVRLLAGDFNSTLDQAKLRDLLATGYTDVASQLGDGMIPTWPYDGRWVPPVPITLDHMFADPRIGAVSLGAQPVKGTDHKAIWATLTLPAA